MHSCGQRVQECNSSLALSYIRVSVYRIKLSKQHQDYHYTDISEVTRTASVLIQFDWQTLGFCFARRCVCFNFTRAFPKLYF